MAADAHPSFEVATIKPGDPNQSKGSFRIGGHRIYIENQSMGSLLSLPMRFIKNRSWTAQRGSIRRGTISSGKQK